MIHIELDYQGQIVNLQSNEKEKIRNIYTRFCAKTNSDLNNIYFMYNGSIINEESTVESVINQLDKPRKKMNIIVGLNNDQNNNKINLIKAEQIICPRCGEIAKIFIKDYLITIFGCKNNHTTNNIVLNKFEETQKVDESKIICNICKNNNKQNSHNKIFYYCLECKINLCLLCKESHNKNALYSRI